MIDMWYGENQSGRATLWEIGDLVRYDAGPTALMRIESIQRYNGEDVATSVRYYGRGFHASGVDVARYHGQCLDTSQEDRFRWQQAHDRADQWIVGRW